MSALSQIAKDPSCLLAVDALQGGRWLSCIKPDGVQPSSVPRNFVEEPETWYDFQNMQLTEDWAHDYTFECTMLLNEKDTAESIFYSGATSSMFGIYQYANNDVGFFTNIIKIQGTPTNYVPYIIKANESEIFWQTPHTVKINVQRNSVFFYIDNELKYSSSNCVRIEKTAQNLVAPKSATGYIDACCIRDDTTGKIVWIYPTWEERTRLLTFNNITTGGGVFRAADESKSAGIKTPLDFRGNTTSKTFIVRAFCPSHDDNTKNLFLHPFFTQGRWTYGKDYFVFGFGIWEDFRGASPMRQLRFAASGDSVAATNPVDASTLLDQWHVFAVSYEMASSGQKFALYADGQLLTSGTNAAEVYPWRSNPTTTPGTDSGKVYVRDNAGDGTYVAGTVVSSALVFDRALTQPEIAAISNTMG